MTYALAVPAAAAVALALLAAGGEFARRRSIALELAIKDYELFYRNAQLLIKDDSVPQQVIDFVVSYLSERAKTANLARLIEKKVIKKSANLASVPPSPIMTAINSMSDRQQEVFSYCVMYAMLASAGHQPLHAKKCRAAILFAMSRSAPRRKNTKPTSTSLPMVDTMKAPVVVDRVCRSAVGYRAELCVA
jgi:hypothetical protein